MRRGPSQTGHRLKGYMMDPCGVWLPGSTSPSVVTFGKAPPALGHVIQGGINSPTCPSGWTHDPGDCDHITLAEKQAAPGVRAHLSLPPAWVASASQVRRVEPQPLGPRGGPASGRARPSPAPAAWWGAAGTHLQLLELQPEVDEPHHGVLLLLRVLRQLQDHLLAFLDGLPQLLDVRGQEQALLGRRWEVAGLGTMTDAPRVLSFLARPGLIGSCAQRRPPWPCSPRWPRWPRWPRTCSGPGKPGARGRSHPTPPGPLWTCPPMGLWRPNSGCFSKHNFPLSEIQLLFWLCFFAYFYRTSSWMKAGK